MSEGQCEAYRPVIEDGRGDLPKRRSREGATWCARGNCCCGSAQAHDPVGVGTPDTRIKESETAPCDRCCIGLSVESVCRNQQSLIKQRVWRRKQSSANSSPVRLFPCYTGKYREIRHFQFSNSQGASAFGVKFNHLATEFPSRLSRENLRSIREPEAGNSELLSR